MNNTKMKPSKNSRRKQRRAEFHAVMNALAKDPSSPDALRQLMKLKEQYFAQVDDDLNHLATETAENLFIRDVLRSVDQGPWVKVQGADGRTVQMKSNLWEYIKSRQAKDVHSAMAAEHLVKRAIDRIQPRP